MGTVLFHFAGSGNHDHIDDSDLEEHMWLTQLRSIRSQVTKSTVDDKCEEYQKFTHDEKTELRDWKVLSTIIEWFRQNNSRVVKALLDHLLPAAATSLHDLADDIQASTRKLTLTWQNRFGICQSSSCYEVRRAEACGCVFITALPIRKLLRSEASMDEWAHHALLLDSVAEYTGDGNSQI
jgi:hypothetical protein